MAEVHAIPNAAVLVRNGVIEEAGPARRIENLAVARKAAETDAGGCVVIPAFVDPDTELVTPPTRRRQKSAEPDEPGAAIRVISEKNAQLRAAVAAEAKARAGFLTVGARTGCAADLRNTLKVLRVHRALNGKPLRIRSLYAHRAAIPTGELMARWLPALRRDRLASVIELNADGAEDVEAMREATAAAAAAGLAVRMRSAVPPSRDLLELALSAGAIAIVAPLDDAVEYRYPLASIGCVRVVRTGDAADLRGAIDTGTAVALSTAAPLGALAEFPGLTAEEAIVATTYNAASSLRLSHVTGSVEPGKSADVVAVEAADYREFTAGSAIRLVIRSGRVIPRSPLIPD